MIMSIFKSIFGDALNSKKTSLDLKIKEVNDSHETVRQMREDVIKLETFLKEMEPENRYYRITLPSDSSEKERRRYFTWNRDEGIRYGDIPIFKHGPNTLAFLMPFFPELLEQVVDHVHTYRTDVSPSRKDRMIKEANEFRKEMAKR